MCGQVLHRALHLPWQGCRWWSWVPVAQAALWPLGPCRGERTSPLQTGDPLPSSHETTDIDQC